MSGLARHATCGVRRHVGYQVRPSKRLQGYGKELLRQGLQKAKELDFTRVLLTCDEDNIASKKIIESNGGQFENAIPVDGSPMKKLRYWIDLDKIMSCS